MNLIFIDTNIYLRFFDSNSKEFKKLLDDLIVVKSNIFVTEQIIDEIERNKLKEFKKSISNYSQNIKIKKVNLPEHIAGNNLEKIEEWNKKRNKIDEENKKLINDFDEILEENLSNISVSKDNVSLKLELIFQNISVASSEEKKLARIRKEIGNPPGKKEDTLGDQITWEQLLNKIPKINEIWIITNDFDFYTKYKKSCYLNPFLFQELLNKKAGYRFVKIS
jgi:predicted nucleic acid-binding protein